MLIITMCHRGIREPVINTIEERKLLYPDIRKEALDIKKEDEAVDIYCMGPDDHCMTVVVVQLVSSHISILRNGLILCNILNASLTIPRVVEEEVTSQNVTINTNVPILMKLEE